MIITTNSLNQLENKLTSNGLGVEIITPEELTYNKILTAINNGILPVLKYNTYDNNIIFLSLSSFFYDTQYYVLFVDINKKNSPITYLSTNINDIMVEETEIFA